MFTLLCLSILLMLSVPFGMTVLVVCVTLVLFVAFLAWSLAVGFLVLLRQMILRALRLRFGTWAYALLLAWLIISLTGCASVLPHEARTRMLGMATPDVLACMGPPAEHDDSVPHLHVWTWSYTDPGASIAFGSMTALGMGVSLQQHGSCRVILAMSGGHVTAIHYSPASDGIAGTLGACKPIVSDCLHFPTRTPLPADYQPDAPQKTATR